MLKSFGTLLEKKQAGAAPALLTALTSLFSCCGEDLSLLDDVFAPVAVWCGDRAAGGVRSRASPVTPTPQGVPSRGAERLQLSPVVPHAAVGVLGSP